MLNARVQELVDGSPPDEEFAFVLEVDTEEAESRAVKIKDFGGRMAALRDVYREAKAPLLEAVNRYKLLGIDVIDELPSTSQMIVAGPAEAWQRLIEDNRDLLDDPMVSVFANEAYLSEVGLPAR